MRKRAQVTLEKPTISELVNALNLMAEQSIPANARLMIPAGMGRTEPLSVVIVDWDPVDQIAVEAESKIILPGR